MEELDNSRSRRGHKRSRAVDNPEGLKEEELKKMRLIDKGPNGRYKKRHLKELSELEVDEIIALAKKPGWLNKDIA